MAGWVDGSCLVLDLNKRQANHLHYSHEAVYAADTPGCSIRGNSARRKCQ